MLPCNVLLVRYSVITIAHIFLSNSVKISHNAIKNDSLFDHVTFGVCLLQVSEPLHSVNISHFLFCFPLLGLNITSLWRYNVSKLVRFFWAPRYCTQKAQYPASSFLLRLIHVSMFQMLGGSPPISIYCVIFVVLCMSRIYVVSVLNASV